MEELDGLNSHNHHPFDLAKLGWRVQRKGARFACEWEHQREKTFEPVLGHYSTLYPHLASRAKRAELASSTLLQAMTATELVH